MPLSMNDFVSQVQEEVNFLHDAYSFSGKNKDEAFAQWFLQVSFPAIDADEAFNLIQSDHNWDANAYYKDVQSGVFHVIHAKYSDEDDPQKTIFGPGVLYGIINVYNKIKTTPPGTDTGNIIINEAIRAKQEDYEISMAVVVFGSFDSAVNVVDIRQQLGLTDRNFHAYSIAELRNKTASLDNFGTEHVLFEFQSTADFSGRVKALVGNLSAYSYRRAVVNLVPNIYDANLRAPLGSTRINLDMKETLEGSDKDLFWYYNNGITILCKSFEKDKANSNLIRVTAPRIVNGAQTTDTILSMSFSQDTPVSLMVRIIEAIPEQNNQVDMSVVMDDLYLNIAKYTNSQNTIQFPDFRSNDLIQRRLHERLKALGWYYERRRGQFRNEKDKSIFAKRVISMEDVAQRWFAFNGNPAIAIREKRVLFEDKGYYGLIFMHSRLAEEYLVAYLVFAQIEKLLTDDIKKAKENTSKANTEGRRVSAQSQVFLIMGRATKRVVAHMSAMLATAIKERYVWNEKTINALLEELANAGYIEGLYADLLDAVARYKDSKGDTKTLHHLLSQEDALDELYGKLEMVLEMERRRGRDSIKIIKLEG